MRDLLIFLFGLELTLLNFIGKLVDFGSHTFNDFPFVFLANLINFIDFLSFPFIDLSLGWLGFFVSTCETEKFFSDGFELGRKLFVLGFNVGDRLVILGDGVLEATDFLLLVFEFLWNLWDGLIFLGELRVLWVNDSGKLLNLLCLLKDYIVEGLDFRLPVEEFGFMLILDGLKFSLSFFWEGYDLLSQDCDLAGLVFKCFFKKIFLGLDSFNLSQSLDNCIVFVKNFSIVSFFYFQGQIVIASDNLI